ncbi:hypothetical protein C8J56DRAFT_863527 [Mycena floridula]|nr:hypothetical protein C8J56DRAFT_863527 [Mycena floridula]
MPKAATKSAVQDPLLIVTDDSKRKRILLPRAALGRSYAEAISILKRHYPRITEFSLETNELEVCDGEFAEITPESWLETLPRLSRLRVSQKEPEEESPEDKAPVLPSTSVSSGKSGPKVIAPPAWLRPASPETMVLDRKIWIIIVEPSGDQCTLHARTTCAMERIFRLTAQRLGRCPNDLVWRYDGCRISQNDTPGSLGMEDNDRIDISLEQRGGKPVIYLFSPTEIDAVIRLSLIDEWKLSAIYPVVAIKAASHGNLETVQWKVKAYADGSLLETQTNLKVSYLFWEAVTQHSERPVSPSEIAFKPCSARLTDENSILLAVDSMTPYLDRSLEALGLHTEARTSFITYWLPSFLKHQYVALRFVPQVEYEHAAPLTLTPKPDVITRIFMLFQGVKTEKLHQWEGALSRAKEEVEWWRTVVGVEPEHFHDESLFRVLEWGGMEVLEVS